MTPQALGGVIDGVLGMGWTPADIVAGFGAVLVLVGSVYMTSRAFLGKRGENENARAKVESEAMSEALSSNLALNEYVDSKIEAAVAPLRTEIEGLRAAHETVRGGFQAYVLDTHWWDRTGREGGLPQVAPDMLRLLGLSHLTEPAARVSGLEDTERTYHERDRGASGSAE